MQVLGRATGPELGQQVHAACAGPVLIAIACAQPYLGRPVPGEDDDRHPRSSFNRRGGESSSLPTSGGWADLLVNFRFLDDPSKHVCELQVSK